MRSRNIQVRGCCMGIPFGCGTLLMLLLAALFIQNPPSASFFVATAIRIIAAVVIAASALIAFEWFLEKRQTRFKEETT